MTTTPVQPEWDQREALAPTDYTRAGPHRHRPRGRVDCRGADRVDGGRTGGRATPACGGSTGHERRPLPALGEGDEGSRRHPGLDATPGWCYHRGMDKSDYESIGRTRKALALLDLLRQADHPWASHEVEQFSDREWEILAEAAGVISPSERTRILIVEAMRRDEALAEDDIFSGTGGR